MNLIVNQYDNSTKALNSFKNADDSTLADVVFAIEFGFKNPINQRTFFHSHMFCFHYCLDSYDGEKNVSFDILTPHEDTNEYCYWKTTSNFYKPEESPKKIQVENTQIGIQRVKEPFDIKDNEPFESVIEKIKLALWSKHESILKEIKDQGINYNESRMEEFSKNLKNFIEVAYSERELSELKPFIKQYQADTLNAMLPVNENKTKKPKI
jgi:hypothetical protein